MDGKDHEIDPRLVELLAEKQSGLFPTQVIVVAGYIDEDGGECWSSHTWGNGNTSGMIGLLEYAKRWLVDSMLHSQSEDEDD